MISGFLYTAWSSRVACRSRGKEEGEEGEEGTRRKGRGTEANRSSGR